MPIKHTYGDLGDACRSANALDLVGDRWSLIIVREVILGPKRFADLQQAARGITPAVLTDRLGMLRGAGIVEQVVLSDPAGTRAYVATEWGRGLEQVLQALGRWYSAGPDPSTRGGMTPDAMVLAMRTMAPPVGDELPGVGLRMYDDRRHDPPLRDYGITAANGVLDIRAGAAHEPRATVTVESTVWSRVLFDALPLANAERDGSARIDGDRDAVVRIVDLFA